MPYLFPFMCLLPSSLIHALLNVSRLSSTAHFLPVIPEKIPPSTYWDKYFFSRWKINTLLTLQWLMRPLFSSLLCSLLLSMSLRMQQRTFLWSYLSFLFCLSALRLNDRGSGMREVKCILSVVNIVVNPECISTDRAEGWCSQNRVKKESYTAEINR